MKQKKLIVALLALTNLMGTGSGVNPSLTTYTNSNQLAKVQYRTLMRASSINISNFKMYGNYLEQRNDFAAGLTATTTDGDVLFNGQGYKFALDTSKLLHNNNNI